MKISKVYRVTPEDTKRIRKSLKEAGFKVSRCSLGSNRFYILVHTSDNRKALPIIEKLGFELSACFETENDHIFQNDRMMIRKVSPAPKLTAEELIEKNAIAWIIDRSEKMIDSEGKEIPGSAHFIGNIPPRMRTQIRQLFKQAGANERDAGRETVFSLSSGETEDDFSVSVSFGNYKSTQNRINFNLTPFTW